MGRDGVRKKEEDRARSDRIGADKGFGESKRARRGGAGGRRAGRQTPNREAAACRARLDLSWARGPLTHARAGEATRLWHPTFQLQGLRGAREMQLARHAGKTRGTGRGARGSRRGMRDARRGVPGGPLSPVPCPPPAESCPTVSPAWSRSAPQSSTAPGLLPGSPDTGDSRGYPLHGGRVGSGPQPASFLARESCSSKLDFPLQPLGSFLLFSIHGTPWRGAARQQVQGWQAPIVVGSARPQSGSLLPRPTEGFPEASCSLPGGLPLTSEGRRMHWRAPVPSGTSPLQSSRPPLELVSEVVVELGSASSAPNRGRCLGRTRPLLHFERLLCVQPLSWESPGHSREVQRPDKETEGAILPRGHLWAQLKSSRDRRS